MGIRNRAVAAGAALSSMAAMAANGIEKAGKAISNRRERRKMRRVSADAIYHGYEPGYSKRYQYQSDREIGRRKRQIEQGRLTASNGLM